MKKLAAALILLFVGIVTTATILSLSATNGPETSSSKTVRFARKRKNKTIRLRSGLEMPAVGYGTCCRPTAKGEAIYESTKFYLEQGGKLIDTAMAYRNHVEIGNDIS